MGEDVVDYQRHVAGEWLIGLGCSALGDLGAKEEEEGFNVGNEWCELLGCEACGDLILDVGEEKSCVTEVDGDVEGGWCAG